MQDLAAAISVSQRHGRFFALHYVDLDGFKNVNDRSGHPVGDLALQEAACRLRRACRAHDVPARLGGDEFVILQMAIEQPNEAETFATRIVDLLAKPYLVGNEMHELGASVGVAIFPDDGSDERTLLHGADAALYRAKANGKNHVEMSRSDLRFDAIA